MNDTPNAHPESAEMQPQPALSPPTTLEALLEQFSDENEKKMVSDFVQPLLEAEQRHQEELLNAETTGYLKGRNEKIDIVTRPAAELPEETTIPVSFPRYARRSVWDI